MEQKTKTRPDQKVGLPSELYQRGCNVLKVNNIREFVITVVEEALDKLEGVPKKRITPHMEYFYGWEPRECIDLARAYGYTGELCGDQKWREQHRQIFTGMYGDGTPVEDHLNYYNMTLEEVNRHAGRRFQFNFAKRGLYNFLVSKGVEVPKPKFVDE